MSCCSTFSLNNLTVLFIDTLFDVAYAGVRREDGERRGGKTEYLGRMNREVAMVTGNGLELSEACDLDRFTETTVNELLYNSRSTTAIVTRDAAFCLIFCHHPDIGILFLSPSRDPPLNAI